MSQVSREVKNSREVAGKSPANAATSSAQSLFGGSLCTFDPWGWPMSPRVKAPALWPLWGRLAPCLPTSAFTRTRRQPNKAYPEATGRRRLEASAHPTSTLSPWLLCQQPCCGHKYSAAENCARTIKSLSSALVPHKMRGYVEHVWNLMALSPTGFRSKAEP